MDSGKCLGSERSNMYQNLLHFLYALRYFIYSRDSQ